jgi:UrcA family protein
MFRTITLAALAALLSLAIVGAAPATAAEVTQPITISTAGIDLSSPQGQSRFERRVEIAARSACAHQSADWDQRAKRSERRCRAQVKADVFSQLGRSTVQIASR